MARNLASIQKVITLTPIPNADKIEVATILGWNCVVKKGEFNVGDWGVYFEIDSIVPSIPVFEFMKERKYRVRTIKLRGAVSQGLFLPLSSFPEIKKPKEGQDVTELLKVEKWEPPEDGPMFTAPKPKSWFWKLVYTLPFLKFLRKKVGEGVAFPTHLVPKTDETRLQAFGPEFIEKYKDLDVVITQKMDGSSCSFIWNKGKFSVASRNVWFLGHKENNFWKIADLCDIKKAMKAVFGKRNIVIQGEMCGPGIQDNKYNFKELQFFVFGMYDSDIQEYFTPLEMTTYWNKLAQYNNSEYFHIVANLKTDVPISSIGTKIEDWVSFATTKSLFNPNSWNEGIVIRSMDNKPYGVNKMEGKRFSFKVINPEFLLQYNL